MNCALVQQRALTEFSRRNLTVLVLDLYAYSIWKFCLNRTDLELLGLPVIW